MNHSIGKRLSKTWELYVMLLPAFVFYIIFKYVPIYGIQIAFRDYMPMLGITGSQWVGLENFRRFFSSADFVTVIRNTLGITIVNLIVGFPIPILLALIVNQITNSFVKKTFQTVTYAPYFISNVVLASMLYIMLSPSTGVVNFLLAKLGIAPVYFMGKEKLFIPIFVASGIWQSAGWSSIIYIAALAGINPELYEAALVDGASKFKRILHVDIPGILPTIVIMLILQVGTMMTIGFERVYVMQNALNLQSSEVLSTFIYKRGLLQGEFSYSAAAGLFESVINFFLLVAVNKTAKVLTENSLW